MLFLNETVILGVVGGWVGLGGGSVNCFVKNTYRHRDGSTEPETS